MSSDSGIPGWAKGCAIGCAGLVVLGIVGAVGLFMAASKGLEALNSEIGDQIQRDFDEQLADGNIPEEHIPLMTDLVEIANNEEISFGMILMCAAAYDTVVNDDSDMDEAEAYEMVQVVYDHVKENPEASVFTIDEFIDEYPAYEEIFENIDAESGSFNFNFDSSDFGRSGNSYEPETVEEETPAAVEDPEPAPAQ